jgi:phenylacetic acid degradation operon negative regulatory protein
MQDGADGLSRAVEALRQDFLARRPVRTASLIVTLFGDAIVPRGGALSIRALIDLTGVLGIEAGAVRTAMSRLVAGGLFERRGVAGRPRYGLSPEGARTFEAAFRRVYAGERPPGGGGFRLLVLPAAAKKAADMAMLEAAGFRPLAAGVHVAPGSGGMPPVPAGAFLFDAVAAPDMVRRVATEALGLGETVAAYRRVAAEQAPLLRLVEASSPSPAEAFVMRTLAVHAFRRAVIHDPALPEDLLPADRPDLEARRIMARLYTALVAPSERHIDAVTAGDGENLPPPSCDLAGRFDKD